ncbi:MAG: hypothetical protein CVT98_02180 [Bacteroidetes bacterium HGW-Bacteroidetes-15]|nr:MAG: hypothetical protein CVT98_02180 [Bacteroidetes bacterium HGW-Bacteroidetes-15]
MRTIVFYFLVLILPINSLAETTVKLKIENVEKNGGKVYVSIFNSEPTYKSREVYLSFILNSDKEIVIKELNLPNGQYVFSIYQDSNGNGKLDTNLIGIPKEKFGFTNYDGKSAPGSYNRHKVVINEKVNEIVVRLYKI